MIFCSSYLFPFKRIAIKVFIETMLLVIPTKNRRESKSYPWHQSGSRSPKGTSAPDSFTARSKVWRIYYIYLLARHCRHFFSVHWCLVLNVRVGFYEKYRKYLYNFNSVMFCRAIVKVILSLPAFVFPRI